ncbi:MAG: type III-B CRISPR module RAMP protein Cmr4 [Caldisericia bacterium]|nr:type III-B CRISPR module RAMP protein Cmr4 [Caldisericia bacterium]
MFIIAETPVHAGSGSELGLVDLPIQRERHTDFPKIEASGLKGCIKEAFGIANKEIELNAKKIRPKDKIKYIKDNAETELNKDYLSLVFGPEDSDEHASAITFTDARILLFPVKSLKGIFAWITCPMVLERFSKEIKMAGINSSNFGNFYTLQNTTPRQSNLAIESKIILEEFTFEVNENDITSGIAEWFANRIFPSDNAYNYWREKLKSDLVILSDDDFKQFVKTSTEVITRTRIDDKTGTVASGALWTEEYLPQDTILYSLVMFTEPKVKSDEQKGIFKSVTPQEEAELVAKFFKDGLPEIVQIGGNQTIGKGFVRLKIL